MRLFGLVFLEIVTAKSGQSQVELRHGDSAKNRRAWAASGLRTPVNNIEYFSPKLREARSRLYRRRSLQVNTRWKALAAIYTMHSFAPFFNLKISAKNRQHFFAIE